MSIVVAGYLPTSASAETPSRTSQCQTAAKELPASGVSYSAEEIAVLTGCTYNAQDSSWTWLIDTGSSTLTGVALSPSELDQASNTRATLSSEISLFDSYLATLSDSLNVAADAKPNYFISLTDFTSEATSYRWGVRPEYSDGPGVKAVYEEYLPLLESFASNPDNILFANYATWWTQRRIGAMPLQINNMNPLAKSGYIDFVAFNRAPWPWELGRTSAINEFARWALANGTIQTTSVSAPSPTPTNTAATQKHIEDCDAMSLWLQDEAQRFMQVSVLISQATASVEPSPSDAAEALANVTAISALADAQEQSNPPDVAQRANDLVVSAWRGYARFWTELAAADKASDQSAFDKALQSFSAASADQDAATKEIDTLLLHCGLGGGEP